MLFLNETIPVITEDLGFKDGEPIPEPISRQSFKEYVLACKHTHSICCHQKHFPSKKQEVRTVNTRFLECRNDKIFWICYILSWTLQYFYFRYRQVANGEGICTNFSSVGISKTVLGQSPGSEYWENPFFLSAAMKKAILPTCIDNEDRECVAFWYILIFTCWTPISWHSHILGANPAI